MLFLINLMTNIIFTKDFYKPTLTWNELLFNFNQSVQNNEFIKQGNYGFYVSHSANKITNLKPILNHLNCNEAHLYISLSTKSESFGKHRDDNDVYFWQCQGITKWVIENEKEYILEPGDLIFVPKNIYHTVISLTPRAGISMSEK
jgi:mannose-6-phosphate isomerase-like protein (cupin superfamily)